MHSFEEDAWNDLGADARGLVAVTGVDDRHARRIGTTRENALQLDVEVAHGFAAGGRGRDTEEVRTRESLRRGSELHALARWRGSRLRVRGEVQEPPRRQPAREH